MNGLSGRKVLLTGGSSGIGAALARLLATSGAEVVIVGRNRARLDAVARQLGERATAICINMAEPADIDRLISELRGQHPNLSLLVNNAALQTRFDVGAQGADAPTAIDAARAEIAVNLEAVIALSLGLLPLLAAQSSAAIVNIGSALGLAPKASAPVYSATKAGLSAFTRALRYQCQNRQLNVRVQEVILPLVDTGMSSGRGKGKISSAAAAEAILRSIEAGQDAVWVGKTRILKTVFRFAPSLARRILRNS